LAVEPHLEFRTHCDDCMARRRNDERPSGVVSNLEQHLSSNQPDIAAQARIIDLEYGVGVEDDCRTVLERGRRALARACAKHETRAAKREPARSRRDRRFGHEPHDCGTVTHSSSLIRAAVSSFIAWLIYFSIELTDTPSRFAISA